MLSPAWFRVRHLGVGGNPLGPNPCKERGEGWPQDPAPPHVCSHIMRTQNTLPSLAPDQLLCISVSLPNTCSSLFLVTCGTPQAPGVLPTSLPTSPVSPAIPLGLSPPTTLVPFLTILSQNLNLRLCQQDSSATPCSLGLVTNSRCLYQLLLQHLCFGHLRSISYL